MIQSFQPTVLRLDSIDSTNLEAMRQARAGAAEGLCIVAREQTQGRGRLDRSWQSPKDAGLYFSIVLRPKLETSAWPLITLMTALAVGLVPEELEQNIQCRSSAEELVETEVLELEAVVVGHVVQEEQK